MTKPNGKYVTRLTESILGSPAEEVRALPSNGPDRHWNWKVTIGTRRYLVRVENTLAVKQRLTRLADEAKIVEFFGQYGLAPQLEASGEYRGTPFMIEQWIEGHTLPSSGRLTPDQLGQVVEFLGRVNAVPVTSMNRRIVRWKEDFLDARGRGKIIEERLAAGRTVPAFRTVIRDIEPVLAEGLELLKRLVRALPSKLMRTPRFVYRDISTHNLFLTEDRCIAVDWEWHSVGLGDPSFSLVVLMRRFHLGPRRREKLIKDCTRRWKIPKLRDLVRVRELERVLGEATWPFGWVARRVKLPFHDLAKEKRGAIKTARTSIAELRRIIRTARLG